MTSAPALSEILRTSTTAAMARASEFVLNQQREDGHWCALLTADTTLESDFILFQLWMHPPVDGEWKPQTRPLIDKAVASILERQNPDGGFYIYEQGPSEISASVKAYVALKLGGIPVTDSRLAKLRERILALGGIQSANSFTKVNLSLFGLYPRDYCPSIPPEILLMPGNLLYQMSSWTRAIVVALAIVHAHNPQRPVPRGFNLEELHLPGKGYEFAVNDSWLTWRSAFIHTDKILKLWEKYGFSRIRRSAIKKCERWMVERFKGSDGLGAIYPPMMYAVMALDVLGYPPTHPLRVEAVRQFDALMIDGPDKFFFQPCYSPIWDSAIAAYSLGEAQAPASKALSRCADWMLDREIRKKGDWSVKRPDTEPSGWAFEYNNEHYPDIDDTAMVLLALRHARGSDTQAQRAAVSRAIDWLFAMQGRDGGWAAFDVDNNWQFLNNVPFADHNAMLDPDCADITGRVLESLAAQNVSREHPAVRRAVEWLVNNQERDGSWYGRWGVAYIYGTCFALRGLAAAGEDSHEPYIQRGNEWLRSVQNADGGWGESCASYDNGIFTGAHSTPSQTAWALMGLIAGGDTYSSSVRNGIRYLLDTQRADGNWEEDLSTGTGFPKVFYLMYHNYRVCFPLIALADYAKFSDTER
ncbi:squalene--hopene cyclase [Nevskia soli]|jgi:squalene-hopene/tetraprenyl-beta-curcumene cyclase|uniref:squalene--hopene cyclase n=1 Tax=Nevskia soli TaxID=418856 RepID=UPI0015D73E56|nr:squalene--hopene cyclase [Nevskia soli]